MAMDDDFNEKFDEVYGKGSATALWNEWLENTIAVETELWEYNEKLSGMSSDVKAAERN